MAEADETGKLTKAYGFNPTTMQLGLWSTDPIWQAETSNGSLTDPKARYDWLHTDHLGTPILATTEEGQTSWRAVSESFGATLPIDQDIEMNLRFPGQYFDAETGTHYNFHRDYRPNAGRYLQGDPIGLEGGANVYVYVDNNSLLSIDNDGLVGITTVDAYCRQHPKECIAPPLPTPIPIPIPASSSEEKKCQTCNDPPFNRYVPCNRLYMYDHHSYDSAYAMLKMINNGVHITRGPSAPAKEGPCGMDTSQYATGKHISFKYRKGRAGTLVSCECCEDTMSGPKLKEKWAVIP